MSDDTEEQNYEEREDRGRRALASGLGAVAGAAIGGPVGAIVGAALGPLLEPVAAHVWEEMGASGRRRTGEALAAAVDAGIPPEQLLSRINSSDRTQLLAAYALAAASRTAWEDKVRTLGRSLAAGLLVEDDARLDTEQMIIAAIADIEGPHLSLLDLLVSYEPIMGQQPAAHNRLDIPAYSYQKSGDGAWDARNRLWDTVNIRRARGNLLAALPSLLGTLQRHGLVVQSTDTDNAFDRITRYLDRDAGFQAQWHIEEDPGVPEQRGTKVRVRSIWAPTELGEEVLLRFQGAGAKLSDIWE
jgi:hypothetical protein